MNRSAVQFRARAPQRCWSAVSPTHEGVGRGLVPSRVGLSARPAALHGQIQRHSRTSPLRRARCSNQIDARSLLRPAPLAQIRDSRRPKRRRASPLRIALSETAHRGIQRTWFGRKKSDEVPGLLVDTRARPGLRGTIGVASLGDFAAHRAPRCRSVKIALRSRCVAVCSIGSSSVTTSSGALRFVENIGTYRIY